MRRVERLCENDGILDMVRETQKCLGRGEEQSMNEN